MANHLSTCFMKGSAFCRKGRLITPHSNGPKVANVVDFRALLVMLCHILSLGWLIHDPKMRGNRRSLPVSWVKATQLIVAHEKDEGVLLVLLGVPF